MSVMGVASDGASQSMPAWVTCEPGTRGIGVHACLLLQWLLPLLFPKPVTSSRPQPNTHARTTGPGGSPNDSPRGSCGASRWHNQSPLHPWLRSSPVPVHWARTLPGQKDEGLTL